MSGLACLSRASQSRKAARASAPVTPQSRPQAACRTQRPAEEGERRPLRLAGQGTAVAAGERQQRRAAGHAHQRVAAARAARPRRAAGRRRPDGRGTPRRARPAARRTVPAGRRRGRAGSARRKARRHRDRAAPAIPPPPTAPGRRCAISETTASCTRCASPARARPAASTQSARAASSAAWARAARSIAAMWSASGSPCTRSGGCSARYSSGRSARKPGCGAGRPPLRRRDQRRTPPTRPGSSPAVPPAPVAEPARMPERGRSRPARQYRRNVSCGGSREGTERRNRHRAERAIRWPTAPYMTRK